jgi:hypothetical protein
MRPKRDQTDYSVEQQKFAAARKRWMNLLSEHQNLQAATIWYRLSEADRQSDRLSWCRQLIEAVYPEGVPRVRRLPSLLDHVQERMEAEQPAWIAACEAWSAACIRETARIARSLQPRQRTAVRKIAGAVEGLSAAMAEERAVRKELAEKAPLPSSSELPDLSMGFGGLEAWDSPFSAWGRKVRQLGILR